MLQVGFDETSIHINTGWPANVTNDSEKEHFISEVQRREGVELEAGKMIKNEALRYIYKLCEYYNKLTNTLQA